MKELVSTIVGWLFGRGTPRPSSGLPPALSSDEGERPLGNLTYDEASAYFTRFCELLQEGVGMMEKESRLPTTFERMKEALKVECLNWANSGKSFDDAVEFIATGYVHLSGFLPDEIIGEGPKLRRTRLVLAAGNGDQEAVDSIRKAMTASDEFWTRRTSELSADWNEFVARYRCSYVRGD